jgi:hypothetical protein
VGAMLTPTVNPQWVYYMLDETIKKSCTSLLASHQRKCEYAWSAWQNEDASHMEIGNEITTHEECIPPLQSVKQL